MWTDTTRAQYARAGLTLPSDLTDAEWALLEPFFPPPSHVGRPRKWPPRRIVEAILKGLRVALTAENLFDSRQKVTDGSGAVPLSYQPDTLDPRGRVLGIDLRKAF